MTIKFTEWPKTSRFFRDIVITEKLDGSNAAIGIAPLETIDRIHPEGQPEKAEILDQNIFAEATVGEQRYGLYAQSRNKLIKPGKTTDNYGFAGWVAAHAEELVTFLGEGLHYGEWWGSGIQRGYGLQKGEKHFSLFNTHRFADIQAESDDLVRCVPILYQGAMVEKEITDALNYLRDCGSLAVHTFMNPEGICVYHTASRLVQKVTLDNNDAGKWEHL